MTSPWGSEEREYIMTITYVLFLTIRCYTVSYALSTLQWWILRRQTDGHIFVIPV